MTRPIPDKQYARDMLRAVSEGQKARNQGATTMKKTAAKKAPPKKARATKSARTVARKAQKAESSSTRKAAKAARTPISPAASRLDPVQKTHVVDAIAKMMAGPNGASMDEMVAATGYDAHQMRSKIKLVRDRLKYTVTPPSKANGRRYHAERPKLADAQ